jgi:hypothetical protein
MTLVAGVYHTVNNLKSFVYVRRAFEEIYIYNALSRLIMLSVKRMRKETNMWSRMFC